MLRAQYERTSALYAVYKPFALIVALSNYFDCSFFALSMNGFLHLPRAVCPDCRFKQLLRLLVPRAQYERIPPLAQSRLP